MWLMPIQPEAPRQGRGGTTSRHSLVPFAAIEPDLAELGSTISAVCSSGLSTTGT